MRKYRRLARCVIDGAVVVITMPFFFFVCFFLFRAMRLSLKCERGRRGVVLRKRPESFLTRTARRCVPSGSSRLQAAAFKFSSSFTRDPTLLRCRQVFRSSGKNTRPKYTGWDVPLLSCPALLPLNVTPRTGKPLA